MNKFWTVSMVVQAVLLCIGLFTENTETVICSCTGIIMCQNYILNSKKVNNEREVI